MIHPEFYIDSHHRKETNMANNGSYSNEKTGSLDVDYGVDPATGGFFNSDFKKHDDLKQMLDTNKDHVKLEAMKRIIGMIAKGRDASDLFPAVVKNVVSKNIEVKKLVYVYLVRYAEEQQDLALLSISTFQRALKDPNQLIRASALRVLSSIRVSVIVPIVMLAIKDSASDLSAYVRKTAAHAIPKLYSLDPEQKDELVLLIDKLLADKTTLVVGSAVMAFEEVCPERIDLIHKNYRKLCNLLLDIDEWGQVVIVNMLTRYARTQFLDPNRGGDIESSEDSPFYDDDDDEDDVVSSKNKANVNGKKKETITLDPDHRLLLRNTKPLLQSRNAAVVMSVAQLYHHCAPRSEVSLVAKSLIRLLRSHREVQSVVLNSIAAISVHRKAMFEPYLKSFFVRTSDLTHIKILKLEVLTNLASESNISVILREFQTYISSQDKKFVAAAIQAIGRCASSIKEVTDSCLTGLVAMLSNRDEAVVAESVVVIKKLLQTQPSAHVDIIRHMAKLTDTITVPHALASILWLLGEYSPLVPTIGPDVLRKMAKNFVNEEDIVKLQVLNLAVKLYLTNPSQTALLCQYVLTLARYDQNYDIRDRSRFLRQFLFPNTESSLSKQAKNIFMATKPAPLLQSKFVDREEFQMGSLSHYINTRAIGYHDLPDFPEKEPDPSVRDVPEEEVPQPKPVKKSTKEPKVKESSFYSDSNDSSSPDEESDSESGSEEESSEEESGSEEEESSSEEDSDKEPKKPVKSNKLIKSATSSSSEEYTDSEEESDSDEALPKVVNKKKSNVTPTTASKPKSNVDLLLDLDDFVPSMSTPVMTPSLGGFLTPVSASVSSPAPLFSAQVTSSSHSSGKSFELLNKINGGKNQLSISGRFTRSPNPFSPTMVSIELTFTNHESSEALTNIHIGAKNLSSGMMINDFTTILEIPPLKNTIGTIGVDFNDSIKPVNFDIVWMHSGMEHVAKVSFSAPVGELVQPFIMQESVFLSKQSNLRGMNEQTAKFSLKPSCSVLTTVLEACNFSVVSSSDNVYRFAGQTTSQKVLVLCTAIVNENNVDLTVNCNDAIFGSMMLTFVKNILSK
nr:PREDICTED: AP-3 complex subunit beta-2 isoform X1 [Bemisia tabaci]